MAQHRAATTQTPRRPNGAGGEEELVGPESRGPNPGGRGTPHCFVPCSTKTVSQNQPLETAASKPVESPKSVSGDWLPTAEIARNRANSRVSQESKFGREDSHLGILDSAFQPNWG